MYTLLSGLYKYMFQKDEYCILILGLDNAGKTTFLEQSKTRFSKNYKGMSLSKITTTVGLNIGTVDVGKARLMFWDLGGQEELQSLWDKPLPGVAPEVVVERSPGAAGRRPGSPSRTLLPARHMWTIKTRDQPGPGLLVQTRGTQARAVMGRASDRGCHCPRPGLWCPLCDPHRGAAEFPQAGALGARPLWLLQYYAECHGVIYVIDSTDEGRLLESKQAFEKVVTSEALDGVPVLVLANKQDVEPCLSIPDIKTAFSDCTCKIGRRDCLTQACSALTGKGVREGIEWMVKCVVRNVHRPPRQRDIT
ncbi:ADP-ribosylation factor-related protein 1 isoform X1 [Oryctolagus cuniculus]|uniref:ADP-ribosylation factor-related protein 1 isoform X1 n=1 Tax=Oryctolagus cuniculus TaxID=9986 RepID=UPI0022309E4E|nr:ADP-ribosylation factor-related protein 1 isoform X2 [Oryctolagus cuniculus]